MAPKAVRAGAAVLLYVNAPMWEALLRAHPKWALVAGVGAPQPVKHVHDLISRQTGLSRGSPRADRPRPTRSAEQLRMNCIHRPEYMRRVQMACFYGVAALASAKGAPRLASPERLSNQPEHGRPQADKESSSLCIAALVLIDCLSTDPEADAKADRSHRKALQVPLPQATPSQFADQHVTLSTRPRRAYTSGIRGTGALCPDN